MVIHGVCVSAYRPAESYPWVGWATLQQMVICHTQQLLTNHISCGGEDMDRVVEYRSAGSPSRRLAGCLPSLPPGCLLCKHPFMSSDLNPEGKRLFSSLRDREAGSNLPDKLLVTSTQIEAASSKHNKKLGHSGSGSSAC